MSRTTTPRWVGLLLWLVATAACTPIQSASSIDAPHVDVASADVASADGASADGANLDTEPPDALVDGHGADAALIPGDTAPVEASDSAATQDASSPVADTVSDPDVAPDVAPVDSVGLSFTTVIVHHPQSTGLQLRGDQAPLSWSQSLPPTAIAGTAATFLIPVKSGVLRLKAVRVTSGALSWAIGANHVVQPGELRHVYPYFDLKHGQGRREDFAFTGPANQPRMVRVFLPPGYDENTLAKYPLLVLFDAQNVFDPKTATFGVAWQVQDAVRSSLLAGKLTELAVAAVDHGGAQRIYEYTPWQDVTFTPSGGGGAKTLDWLGASVLPELRKRYRLLPGRPVIGGSSLGGLMSLFAAVDRPTVWRGAMAMSGSWWWNQAQMLTWAPKLLPAALKAGTIADAKTLPQLPPGTTLIGGATRIWLDAGTVKDGLDVMKQLHAALVGLLASPDLGFYVHQGAGHTESAWQQRVHLPLRFFFDPGDREAAF